MPRSPATTKFSSVGFRGKMESLVASWLVSKAPEMIVRKGTTYTTTMRMIRMIRMVVARRDLRAPAERGVERGRGFLVGPATAGGP